jgi:hypothetical protein
LVSSYDGRALTAYLLVYFPSGAEPRPARARLIEALGMAIGQVDGVESPRVFMVEAPPEVAKSVCHLTNLEATKPVGIDSCARIAGLWHRLLGRQVSESGRLRHGDGAPRKGRALPVAANIDYAQ